MHTHAPQLPQLQWFLENNNFIFEMYGVYFLPFSYDIKSGTSLAGCFCTFCSNRKKMYRDCSS